LKFEFEIKRGHFLKICKYKITLNFILKLQKLQIPKLYIYPRPTTLLFKPFSNYASILKFEFGDEKGSNLEFASFQNYSRFYTKTLKTQNTKLVAIEKIYKLGFTLFPKFCLDFELIKKG
jgi:hypothetical protein